MAVLKGPRNYVCAYEPLPEDQYVETWLVGSEERHLLLTQPIERYREAVDWAVSVMDKFASPISVLPVTAREARH